MKPRAPIRRFDVFAEYNRQKAINDGLPEDEAAGYGLWVAKVVAGRRFGSGVWKQPAPKVGEMAREKGMEAGEAEPKEKPKWHTLDGKPQTEDLFEKEVVDRMGPQFYEEEFVPAIRKAMESGRSYESIRDTIRKEWVPGK